MWFRSSKKEPEPVPVPESASTQQDGISTFASALQEAYDSKSSSPIDTTTKTTTAITTTPGKDILTKREAGANKIRQLPLDKFPKEMSCVTAINEVMECMSLGGQVRHYYRYGDFTMCERQNEKLNFCFKNSLTTGDVKEKNIRQFFKDRMVEEMKRGSSEDIWDSKI